jgi:hypothetical protein
MDHPIFGSIRRTEAFGSIRRSGGRGEEWIGAVEINFFSGFDDVTPAVFAQKFGGRDHSKTADQGYKRGPSRLVITCPEGDPPSPSQERAFLQFLGDQELICAEVVKAIFDHYRREREMWFTGDEATDEIMVPEVRSPDDLKRLIRLHELRVLGLSKDGCSLIGFCFHCCWDIEHGLGALVHGTRVVEVGENDITWNGPSTLTLSRAFRGEGSY